MRRVVEAAVRDRRARRAPAHDVARCRPAVLTGVAGHR